MDIAMMAGLVMLVSIVFLLLIGVPIAISVGMSSALAMICILGFSGGMATSAQRVFTGTNSFPLLAIPFFILAGNIMNTGGIALRLVNCAKVLAGRMPGALAHTNVIASMLFGSISGSGVAACAAIGGTMGPIEEKEGYDKNFITAVNVAAAPSGMLIPPSNTLLVYTTVASSVSVAALFVAGYLPGLIWGLGMMAVVWFMAKKRGYVSSQRVSFKVAVKTVIAALPSLFLIIIVIGGILKGVFTATEGSAIAVVYSLVLSIVYRNFNRKQLKEVLLGSMKMTTIVVFMIAVSSIMSWVMSFAHIPAIVANALMSITDNKIIIFLIMNIVLLVIGCFMDATPAILIFTPIFLPICMQFGMHPIQFGILITFNMCIGTITPPVGPSLFTGCKIMNIRIEDVFKTILPFYGAAIIGLMFVTYFSQISMFLPTLLGLVK